jgi:hypothetical protein
VTKVTDKSAAFLYAITPIDSHRRGLEGAVRVLDAIIAAILATFGVFGMKPIPFTTTLIVIAYSFFSPFS